MKSIITRFDTKNARHEIYLLINNDQILEINLYDTYLQTDRHHKHKTFYKNINKINDDKLAELYKEIN